MRLEVHFTMKGIPGSIKHSIEVDNMEDDTIHNKLFKDIKEHLNHAQIHMNKLVLTIFLIIELTC